MKMNEVDRYVRDVLRNIEAPPRDRERIEGDLRAHIQEAVDSGESPSEVIKRMGSPSEVAAEFMAGVKLRYASFWRRLAAFVLDLAIIVGVDFPLVGLAILLANLVPQQPQGFAFAVSAILIAAVAFLGGVALGLVLLYFPILEGRFGRTVGKRLFGMRVLKEDGTPIGYKEAFLRRLSFYFEFLVIDALFIPFTEKHQRAFDIVARTIVVREESR